MITKLDIRNLGAPEFMLARTVFNLSGESGPDPERVAREQREAEERRAQAAAFQARAQLTLEKCPGFITCDPPSSPGSTGKIVVEPSHLLEASEWLKRRYHVAENLELSRDLGVAFEIAPRNRGSTSRKRKVKVCFGKPEQFQLAL